MRRYGCHDKRRRGGGHAEGGVDTDGERGRGAAGACFRRHGAARRRQRRHPGLRCRPRRRPGAAAVPAPRRRDARPRPRVRRRHAAGDHAGPRRRRARGDQPRREPPGAHRRTADGLACRRADERRGPDAAGAAHRRDPHLVDGARLCGAGARLARRGPLRRQHLHDHRLQRYSAARLGHALPADRDFRAVLLRLVRQRAGRRGRPLPPDQGTGGGCREVAREGAIAEGRRHRRGRDGGDSTRRPAPPADPRRRIGALLVSPRATPAWDNRRGSDRPAGGDPRAAPPPAPQPGPYGRCRGGRGGSPRGECE